MRAFELALHPEKTRLIRFGRHAAKQREKLGEGKPETFDFLGFTHFCTRSRKWGSFVIGRKTIKKRMRAKLKAIKMELRKTNARPHRENRSVGEADAARASELLRRLGQRPEPVVVLQRGEVALAQVAQAAQPERASLSWEKFIRLVDRFFPPIRVLHPLPCHRFDAKTRGRSPVR